MGGGEEAEIHLCNAAAPQSLVSTLTQCVTTPFPGPFIIIFVTIIIITVLLLLLLLLLLMYWRPKDSNRDHVRKFPIICFYVFYSVQQEMNLTGWRGEESFL